MILDSSFLIDVMRASPPAMDLRGELEGGSEALRIPAPVIYELWEGIERSRAPPRELEIIEETLRACPIIPFSFEHAKRAGALSGALGKRGVNIGDVDLMIAGMALVEGETILTRNVRDFERVPDVRVRSY